LQYALKSEAVRADLIAMARDMGYNLRIEKKREKGEKKDKYRFIFSRLEIPQESDRLRAILKKLGIKPNWDTDWDGDAAPMTEPLPQNGHAPMPEVHTPTPAPQIAHPAPDPAPMAAKGTPAEVGGGVPMAAPAPEKPMAIAVQSAQKPTPKNPTPEQNERAIAELRETLNRLPKPEGILQQKGALIEGVHYAPAPPELTEYLRAMAGALAAEAVMAAEKGRFAEAGWLWASAGEYLVHLTAFEPTREVIAALFLARACAWAYLAAQGTPEMREAAGLFAKLAGAVFFGKAAPDVLLEVLLRTPAPREADPCLAPHYREAGGYLVAAHWVLTGKDPKLLSEWIWPGRWKRDDVEAMLLFSLGSEKKSVAGAHLYLGDLPF
jgi:cell pole-organizing protein PopZ